MSTNTFETTTVRVGPGPVAMLFRALLVMILIVGALVGGVTVTRWFYTGNIDEVAQVVDEVADLVVGERLFIQAPHGEEALTVRAIDGTTASITDLDGDVFTCSAAGLLTGNLDCTATITPPAGVQLVQTDRGARYMDEATRSTTAFTYPCAQPYLALDQSAWSCDGKTWISK